MFFSFPLTLSFPIACIMVLTAWIVAASVETTTPTSPIMKAVTCDCKGNPHVAAIALEERDCMPPREARTKRPVRYTVYTNKPESKKITGVMCSRWKNVRKATTTFLLQAIEVPCHMAIDTPVDECLVMKTRRICGSNAMKYMDSKWIFDAPPSPSHIWLSTTEAVELNCILEELTLTFDHESGMITTPLGKVNASTGTYSHNHVTVVWDQLVVRDNPGEKFPIASGNADLRKFLQGTYIMDYENQADYHVELIPCSGDNCIEKYKVIGSDRLTIEINGPGNPTPPLIPYGVPRSLYNVIQFVEDKLTDNTNVLVSHVRNVQCKVRRLQYAQATTTALYNGWLAASQLDLPTCTKLIASGETLLILKCEKKEISFHTEVTRCGAQLRHENQTLSLDGWELVPYSPCYSNLGFTNINGQPYVYKNDTWTQMDREVIKPSAPLTRAFNYIDLVIKPHQRHRNPAYPDAMSSHMNVMADIIAAMNENNNADSESKYRNAPLSQTHHEAQHLSLLDSLYLSILLFFVFILICILFRIAYAFELHILIWKMCCKPPATPAEIHEKIALQNTPPTSIE